MTIILLTLKIIGMVLLAVLGLFLLTLAAALFVPVRYRIMGEINGNVNIGIRVSWLLHMVSFRAAFENQEFQQKLRILGIPLKKKEEKTPKEKKIKKEKQKKIKPEKVKAAKPEKKQKKKPLLTEKTESGKIVQGYEPEDTIGQADRNASKNGNSKVSIPGMLRDKWETLKEKVKGIRGIFHRIKTELQDENNRGALKAVFRELKCLLKHAAPRKAKGNIAFGMEDPAATGQILGAVSILPCLYRYEIQLQPDFETESFYIKGTFDIKGHARGIHVLLLGYRLLKDKNIRSLIQRYRNS